MPPSQDTLLELWESGYSIAELWGFTLPVMRQTSEIVQPYALLWGILRLAEDQINVGAGHRYLRERVAAGDWIGIGWLNDAPGERKFIVIPKIKNAKFGQKSSAIGDSDAVYINARFVHTQLFDAVLRQAEGDWAQALADTDRTKP